MEMSESSPEPVLVPEENPGIRLTAARRAANMSQATLAERLGVSMASVNRWERGSRRPGPNEAAQLQTIFDIPATVWTKSGRYAIAMAYAFIGKNFTNPKPAYYAIAVAILLTSDSSGTCSADPKHIRSIIHESITLDEIVKTIAILVEKGLFVSKGGALIFS